MCRVFKIVKDLRRITVIVRDFHGAGTGAENLGPCVSKYPRNRLAAVRVSLRTAFSTAAVVLSTGVLSS